MIEHAWRELRNELQTVRTFTCETCAQFRYGKDVPDVAGCPGGMTITVRYVGDFAMRIGQIWPDGDQPDPIDLDAIATFMRQYSISDLILDWDLAPTVLIAVNNGREVQIYPR